MCNPFSVLIHSEISLIEDMVLVSCQVVSMYSPQNSFVDATVLHGTSRKPVNS